MNESSEPTIPAVPDFMPVLSAGAHGDPSQGACVMEYVSMLAGEPFTDAPRCTNPIIAKVAQAINDTMDEPGERSALVPLIPRLFGTDDARPGLDQALAEWVLAHLPEHDKLDRAIARFEAGDYQTLAFWNVTTDNVDLLEGLLDEYDRLTCRTQFADVTPDTLRSLVEEHKVGAGVQS